MRLVISIFPIVPPSKTGFSLVELSIVLVILGLLTGGILSGQSLIRAAEIRAASAEWQRYSASVYAFRDRYLQLPGDMTNATAFWGIAAGTGSDTTCYSFSSTTIATCNGNGNGAWNLSDGVADFSAPETFRLWQHLANAGLVEGSYTGTANGATRTATPGRNCPRSRVNNAGWSAISFSATNDGTWFKGRYLGFFLGAPSAGLETFGPAFRPEEVWNIDVKLDDGKPATGRVRSFASNSCTNNNTVSAEYNLSSTSISCPVVVSIADPGT